MHRPKPEPSNLEIYDPLPTDDGFVRGSFLIGTKKFYQFWYDPKTGDVFLSRVESSRYWVDVPDNHLLEAREWVRKKMES